MTRKRGEPGVQAKSLAACSSLLALSSATGSRTEDATKNTAGRSRWTDWAETKNEGWRFLSQDGPRPNANITDVPPKHTYWFLCLVTFSCRYYVVPFFFFILFSKIQHQQNHCWIIFTFKSLSGAAPPKNIKHWYAFWLFCSPYFVLLQHPTASGMLNPGKHVNKVELFWQMSSVYRTCHTSFVQ